MGRAKVYTLLDINTYLYIYHVVRSTRAPGPSCEALGYRKGTTTVQLC